MNRKNDISEKMVKIKRKLEKPTYTKAIVNLRKQPHLRASKCSVPALHTTRDGTVTGHKLSDKAAATISHKASYQRVISSILESINIL